MEKTRYVFIAIFIAFGIYLCFFGVKAVQVTVFLTGFLFTFLVVLFISFAVAVISLTETNG